VATESFRFTRASQLSLMRVSHSRENHSKPITPAARLIAIVLVVRADHFGS